MQTIPVSSGKQVLRCRIVPCRVAGYRKTNRQCRIHPHIRCIPYPEIRERESFRQSDRETHPPASRRKKPVPAWRCVPSRSRDTENPFRTVDARTTPAKRTIAATKRSEKLHFIIRKSVIRPSKTNPLLKSQPDNSCEKEWFMIVFSPCAKRAVFFHPALLFSGRFAVSRYGKLVSASCDIPPSLPSLFQFDPCCMEHSFGIA